MWECVLLPPFPFMRHTAFIVSRVYPLCLLFTTQLLLCTCTLLAPHRCGNHVFLLQTLLHPSIVTALTRSIPIFARGMTLVLVTVTVLLSWKCTITGRISTTSNTVHPAPYLFVKRFPPRTRQHMQPTGFVAMIATTAISVWTVPCWLRLVPGTTSTTNPALIPRSPHPPLPHYPPWHQVEHDLWSVYLHFVGSD